MAVTSFFETTKDTLVGDIDGGNVDFTPVHTVNAPAVLLAWINTTPVSASWNSATEAIRLSEAPLHGDTVSVWYLTTGAGEIAGAVSAMTLITTAMQRINRLGAGQTISARIAAALPTSQGIDETCGRLVVW